ncbi:MAG: (2Fe-2S)-binding protein [Planctomycetota bacterium JB042]
MPIETTINGTAVRVESTPDTPLLWVLRDELGLVGTKFGCGRALCGACTVHVDGRAVRACAFPIRYAAGKEIRTVESIEETEVGRAVVEAWIGEEVVQCGWCQPGQCMSAVALLKEKPAPTDDDVDAAMSGNLCRCGTYTRIREAIRGAARALAAREEDR